MTASSRTNVVTCGMCKAIEPNSIVIHSYLQGHFDCERHRDGEISKED